MRDGDRAPKCGENGPLLQFSGSRQTGGSVLTTASFALFLEHVDFTWKHIQHF
jgi:hypothetical protein